MRQFHDLEEMLVGCRWQWNRAWIAHHRVALLQIRNSWICGDVDSPCLAEVLLEQILSFDNENDCK